MPGCDFYVNILREDQRRNNSDLCDNDMRHSRDLPYYNPTGTHVILRNNPDESPIYTRFVAGDNLQSVIRATMFYRDVDWRGMCIYSYANVVLPDDFITIPHVNDGPPPEALDWIRDNCSPDWIRIDRNLRSAFWFQHPDDYALFKIGYGV